MEEMGYIGLALQDRPGVWKAPQLWLPVIQPRGDDDQGFWRHRETQYLNLGTRYQVAAQTFESGAAGTLTVPLVPGAMAMLLSWVQDKDAQGSSKWASLTLDHGVFAQAVTDAKVQSARFVFNSRLPAHVVLYVVALAMDDTDRPGNVNLPVVPPYAPRECEIELALNEGPLEVAIGLDHFEVWMENDLDGLRNTDRGMTVTGTLRRGLICQRLHADYVAKREGAMVVSMTRGASGNRVALPRVQWTQERLALRGMDRWQEAQRVSYRGLGSVDGLTPPVVLS